MVKCLSYGLECDNWALGVIMYVLICGCFPFFGENNNEIFKEIRAAKVSFKEKQWKKVSSEGKDLIRLLLNPDPKERYTSA
jgi:serine/threonine protein kinase